MRRASKGLGHLFAVAVVEVQTAIAWCIRVQLWRIVGRRCTGGCHRGKGVDVDKDRLGCILRLFGGLGHHHCYRLANIAHTIGGQWPLPWSRRGRTVAVLRRGCGHVLDSGSIQVGCRDDQVHARHLACNIGLDRSQFAMCHPAAHRHAIQLARQV
jgi:hypothetical protein